MSHVDEEWMGEWRKKTLAEKSAYARAEADRAHTMAGPWYLSGLVGLLLDELEELKGENERLQVLVEVTRKAMT